LSTARDAFEAAKSLREYGTRVKDAELRTGFTRTSLALFSRMNRNGCAGSVRIAPYLLRQAKGEDLALIIAAGTLPGAIAVRAFVFVGIESGISARTEAPVAFAGPTAVATTPITAKETTGHIRPSRTKILPC
jgi:hypothetical protein